jgi:hypothetical protein
MPQTLAARPEPEVRRAPAGAEKARKPAADYLFPALVAAAAVTLAALTYRHFLDVSRLLWWGTGHDRHAHYFMSLSMALDLRQGNVLHFIHDLDASRTYPPLHGIVDAVVLIAGGLDYRVAVLPGLAGWVGTALLGFLVARRAAPRGGNFAGLVAALFILASPAFHAYATDVMLESLGACLSLLVLYLYQVAVQGRTRWAYRGLALALTALFYYKYNYWLLLVFALAASEVFSRPRELWQLLRRGVTGTDWPRCLRDQFRHPLNYLLAAVLAVLAVVHYSGGLTVGVGGRQLSIHTPHNLIHLAYVVFFLRVASWWWRAGRGWTARLSPPARTLVFWHALPVAVWFLWPQRLSYFLWFLSPANAPPKGQFDPLEGPSFYWKCLVSDYHPGRWMTILVLGFLACGLLGIRRLRPGGQVIFWFAFIAAALTFNHPNHQSRYLHSWVAACWVGAGVGSASLLFGLFAHRWQRARPWVAAAAACGLGFVLAPGFVQPGHAREGGVKLGWRSTLDLSDCYLSYLAGARRTAVLATVPSKFVAQWTYLDRYHQQDRIETDLKGYGTTPDEHRRCFRNWLKTTACDTLVFIDVPRWTAFYTAENEAESYKGLGELLPSQSTFRLVHRQDLPRSGCSVTVWSRGPGKD